MAIGHIDVATNRLQENVGKFAIIYHKWQHDIENDTYCVDECVVKILRVFPINISSPIPYVEVEFCNGKKARLSYASEYAGQLLLFWDYDKLGKLYNDFFIKNEDGRWVYTYPDLAMGEKLSDMYLTTGIHQIKFFSSMVEEKTAIVNYIDHLDEAYAYREAKRIDYRNNREVLTIENKEEKVPAKGLNSIFHTA